MIQNLFRGLGRTRTKHTHTHTQTPFHQQINTEEDAFKEKTNKNFYYKGQDKCHDCQVCSRENML